MILDGDPPISITLKPSTRARRLSIRVSHINQQVTMTLPKNVPHHEAEDFARQKAQWVRRQLSRCPQPIPISLGGQILLEGRKLHIMPIAEAPANAGTRPQPRKNTAPFISDEQLYIDAAPHSIARRLKTYLKHLAHQRLLAACDFYSAKLGIPFTRITLRDTHSRWGSCSSEGHLMFSWRLIMAPPDVLDYVAAHEVAHLAEMNHGPDFWALVGWLKPGYEQYQNWLRDNGGQLHRYRFDS